MFEIITIFVASRNPIMIAKTTNPNVMENSKKTGRLSF